MKFIKSLTAIISVVTAFGCAPQPAFAVESNPVIVTSN